jgi:hypothetical protein
LIQQLEAGEIENAAAIAEILFDLEVFQDIEPFWGLFKDPESSHILQMADQIHTNRISNLSKPIRPRGDSGQIL